MSVFKNYDAGEPTCRLYVKNVAKQVEEKVGPAALHGQINWMNSVALLLFTFFLHRLSSRT